MNKKLIIPGVIIAVLLVISITLYSFAYFAIENKEGDETVISSGNMAILFTDGNDVSANSILPGEYVEKEFSVKNTGSVNTKYDVYISEVINSFVDKTDLVYELISEDGGYNTTEAVQVPSVPQKIISEQAINLGETHHYKLKITFLNRDVNQNANQGKIFNATIQINEYKEVKKTINYYLDNVLVNYMPSKDVSIFLNSSCNKGATLSFNTETWSYEVLNITEANTTCNIYFNNKETHKGIVYLDPTNLYKTCTKAQSDANVNSYGTPTEIKTGCMKWYIYDDSGDNYKMILDHNTHAGVKFNGGFNNYETSTIKEVVDLLSTPVSNGGSGWQVSARLISGQELANINHASGWTLGNTNSHYGMGNTPANTYNYLNATQKAVRQAYSWLFDYSNNCITYGGCLVEDNNLYSDRNVNYYWTSTGVNSGNQVWTVNGHSGIVGHNFVYEYYGIRPVIEISKSLVN